MKKVIVTGASSGIGEAIASALESAVPYELYKGLTFTTIWLEVNSRKKMFERLCLRRAFLIIKVVESSDEKCFNLFLSNDEGDNYFCRSFFFGRKDRLRKKSGIMDSFA